MTRKLALFSAFVLLSACGKVGDLEPRTAQSVPAKNFGQAEAPGANELTTPSVQARPGRSDELLLRSEQRNEDPFDLPPGLDPIPLDPKTQANAKSKTKKP